MSTVHDDSGWPATVDESSPSHAMPNQDANREFDITFVKFNQNNSSLIVGTSTGFRLFSIESENLEPLYTWPADDPQCQELVSAVQGGDQEKVETNTVVADPVLIVERLFSSKLVVFVTKKDPKTLKLLNFAKGKMICLITFPTTILSVQLNCKRLVVCLEDFLYIYSIPELKPLRKIKDMSTNSKGLFALSIKFGMCYLAYPASSERGDVSIFDAKTLTSKHPVVPAHTSQLASMVFSPSGELMATASVGGTVIKIFDVESGKLVNNLRCDIHSEVKCLSFCPDSYLLALTSNTETVHLFKARSGNQASAFSLEGMGTALLNTASSYLPATVGNTLGIDQSFATITINRTDGAGSEIPEHAVALIHRNEVRQALLASKEGYFYIHDTPPDNASDGTACKLLEQHHLDPNCLENTSIDRSLPSWQQAQLKKDAAASIQSSEEQHHQGSPDFPITVWGRDEEGFTLLGELDCICTGYGYCDYCSTIEVYADD